MLKEERVQGTGALVVWALGALVAHSDRLSTRSVLVVLCTTKFGLSARIRNTNIFG